MTEPGDRPCELLDMDGLPLQPDWAAIARYEQQMRDAFNAVAQGRDCFCGADVNPFCKIHPGYLRVEMTAAELVRRTLDVAAGFGTGVWADLVLKALADGGYEVTIRRDCSACCDEWEWK